MLNGKNIFHRRKEVPSSGGLVRELGASEAVYLERKVDENFIELGTVAVYLERKVDENFIELGTAIEEMSVLVGVLCIVTSFCMGYIIWELITKGGE